MNPVQEWLARVAEECGSPEAMLMWSSHVSNTNSRKLIADYATKWHRRRRTEANLADLMKYRSAR